MGLLKNQKAEETASTESIKQSVMKRLPWLFLLLFLGMLVSSVVSIFERLVSKVGIIMCYQSLILGMAGNVGTQSLAISIQTIIKENLTHKQEAVLIFKEAKIGFLNGLILGIASFIILCPYIHFIRSFEIRFSAAIAGCVSASLLFSLSFSSTIGIAVPLLLKKIKIDPAIASGPIIMTINDLLAVLTYYGLCWLLLIKIL